MATPTAPIAGASLVGGYMTARFTGVRPLGGLVLAGAGGYLTKRWHDDAGDVRAATLLATYLGGFGVSHPLAKKIGAWPAVFSVAAVSAGASYLLSDRAAPGTIAAGADSDQRAL